MSTTNTKALRPIPNWAQGDVDVLDAGPTGSSPRAPRRPLPTPVAEFDTLRSLLRMPEFWLLVLIYTRQNAAHTGRPQLTPEWVKMTLLAWGWERVSLNDLVAHISQPEIWSLFRRYANRARPKWAPRVPSRPPTVAQMKYTHKRLNGWSIERARAATQMCFMEALKTAKQLGYFGKASFQYSSPDWSHFANYDGTVFRSPYASNVKDTASALHLKCGEPTNGSKFALASVHDHRTGMRVILDCRFVPAGPTGSPGDEAKQIVESAKWLKEYLGDSLHGITVDTILRGTHVVGLQALNIHVVNHPAAKSNPKSPEDGRFGPGYEPKTAKIAVVAHTTRRGNLCNHDIYSIAAAFSQRAIDDEGNGVFESLEVLRHETRPNKSTGTCRHYQQMLIKCVHGDFTHRFPLFHMELGSRQVGEYVRTYAPRTELFEKVYGWRNDTESLHAQLKRRRTRMPAHGAAAQQVSMTLWCLWHNAKAVHRAGLTLPLVA